MQHDYIRSLRKQGYRLTPQRLLILDVMERRGEHMSADEVYAEVQARRADMNLTTVYRTLQWLHSVGLLHKIDVGKDRVQYEFARDHMHHHLVCRHCGGEQEIDNRVIDGVREHILDHYGFEADPDHLAIFGRCAECRTGQA